MWKYMNKEKCNKFLLSLNLIDGKEIDKEKIKKLYSISNKIESNYKVFKIKKQNGKTRTIYKPSYILKSIQRNILNNILNNKEISKYAKAYHKGISLKENAIPHINKNKILKLDIKNFFDNISFLDIYNSCFSISYFPKQIGMLLTYLCTYNEHLPQGAPTSAYISNLVMKEFDEELGSWCDDNNISYTRYSDDMTFSGDFDPSLVIKKVRKMLYKLGLEINEQKVHVINKNNRQKITGIVVNKKLQAELSYRKKIRQEIYFIKKYGLKSHLNHIGYKESKEKYIRCLLGKTLFVLQLDPNNKEFINYKKYLLDIIRSI